MISSLELARLCGLSQGTVDRALHDRPGISPATKARVLEMAAERGYRPHPAARELLTGQRRTVGAIVPALNSVFFMDLVSQIREAVAPLGFRFLIHQVSDEVAFFEALHYFAASRARLVAVVPPGGGVRVGADLTRSMEVVSLINPIEGPGVRTVMPDEVATGRTAARYLMEKGHRRILHLRPERSSPAIERRAEGYATELAARGLESKVVVGFDAAAFPEQVRAWSATAVFCHNDWLALSTIRSLNAAGLRVPEDVSVLGVDDSPSFHALCPDITTLHYPAETIAAGVAAILQGEEMRAVAAAWVVERETVRAV